MQNTEQAITNDDAETTCTTTEISAKEFKDFKSFLRIVKMSFSDLSLVDGTFRSLSNNGACIVETGFRFFMGMSFDIFNIKSFLKSISALDKKNRITATVENSSIIFEDHLGNIQFSLSNTENSGNKFISDEEMINTWLNYLDPNKLILSDAIPKINVRRINTMALKLYSDHITFKHDKDDLSKGFLSITGRSDDSSELKIELKKPLIIPLEENHYFRFPILPALFNRDDMFLKCYFTNDQNIFSIFSTKVNDLFVNIYSKSALIENSEEG
jgi:hypothetical protein